MSTSKNKPDQTVKEGGEPSPFARLALEAAQSAVDKAIDRKRRLGQYWVVADADGKPVKIYPENSVDSVAE